VARVRLFAGKAETHAASAAAATASTEGPATDRFQSHGPPQRGRVRQSRPGVGPPGDAMVELWGDHRHGYGLGRKSRLIPANGPPGSCCVQRHSAQMAVSVSTASLMLGVVASQYQPPKRDWVGGQA